MNCNELSTEAYYKLPIITVVFNNRTLGMVRQLQSLFYHKRYSQTDLDHRGPDFVKLAEAFGLSGCHVRTVEQLEEALKAGLACGHGYVIDCAIKKDEMVRPMVASGKKINDFVVD